jgi:transketolase
MEESVQIDLKSLNAVAAAVRVLTMDAVQKAKSGHPGLPMGCADLGSLIYGEILSHYPADPAWINRDRFVLSAGHGSMLLYSLLHLSGYDLSLEELKNFRQHDSLTPGHPEYGLTPGVETTTGPLGQGISNSVGLAMAERMLAARFNTETLKVIDHYTYVLCGDGDLMEGVSAEAASLAGHHGLGKLIVFYDSNSITIEGSTDLAFTEDVLKRFAAYGWQTLSGDAYDLEGIMKLVKEAQNEENQPTIIKLKSVIGKGSPNMAGSHKVHGAPLGEDEVKAAKIELGVPEDSAFYIPREACEYFTVRREGWQKRYSDWQDMFNLWRQENPRLASEWDLFFQPVVADNLEFPLYNEGDKLATRKAGGEVLNAMARQIPNLIGGSADLAPSNVTELKGMGSFQKGNPKGRNLHFGVREHGMGAIANGLALHGGIKPFCATFLVFSDYMRPAIRLAAMMRLPVIYIFTHDSVFVGEDGPTHQPVEHITALRSIPNLVVLRPGDAQETAAAWKLALARSDGPTVLALTRQGLEVYAKDDAQWVDHVKRGAYIVKDCEGSPEIVLVATGSEVSLALGIAGELGSGVRVVSMISRELFLQQQQDFKEKLIPGSARRVVIEAGISMGWEGIAGFDGIVQSINHFGESGPAGQLAGKVGLTVQQIVARIKS